MTSHDFHDLCLALPAATMDVQWGADRVYKVGGKMFAVLGSDGACSFKASDVAFEMLVAEGLARPAPYLARAKWVSVSAADAMDSADLRAYLEQAHRLIADKLTRKARQALGLA